MTLPLATPTRRGFLSAAAASLAAPLASAAPAITQAPESPALHPKGKHHLGVALAALEIAIEGLGDLAKLPERFFNADIDAYACFSLKCALSVYVGVLEGFVEPVENTLLSCVRTWKTIRRRNPFHPKYWMRDFPHGQKTVLALALAHRELYAVAEHYYAISSTTVVDDVDQLAHAIMAALNFHGNIINHAAHIGFDPHAILEQLDGACRVES